MQQCDSCDATTDKTYHTYHHRLMRWVDVPACDDCATRNGMTEEPEINGCICEVCRAD